jgi:hypothetical protein
VINELIESVKSAEKNACYGNGEPTADDPVSVPEPDWRNGLAASAEHTPVDVVLLARSSTLLCKAMAFILLDFKCGKELRDEIIQHLDETSRAMQATGRLNVYRDVESSIFHADGAAKA